MGKDTLAINGGSKAIEGFESKGQSKIGHEEFLEMADTWGYSQETIDEIRKVIDKEDLGAGPFLVGYKPQSKVFLMEAYAAELFNVKNVLAVTSGTAALHTAYVAADICYGDEVIIPGYTFMATAMTAVVAHGIPVWCEIDESMTIPYVAADGAQVLLPRLERIRGMTSKLLEDSPVITESWDPDLAEARILVRADASRPDLAIEIADYLRRRGYTARAESDGLQIESEGTFIGSRREMADTAALISALLHVDPEFVILDHNLREGSDIVVTLGRSFVMPE